MNGQTQKERHVEKELRRDGKYHTTSSPEGLFAPFVLDLRLDYKKHKPLISKRKEKEKTQQKQQTMK